MYLSASAVAMSTLMGVITSVLLHLYLYLYTQTDNCNTDKETTFIHLYFVRLL